MKGYQQIAQMAEGRWHGILSNLGVDGGVLSGRNQPCPLPSCASDKGGKDRFRWTNYQETGAYFCNGCGSGDGFEFAGKYLGLDPKQTLSAVSQLVDCTQPPPRYEQRKPKVSAIEKMKKISDECVDIESDEAAPVIEYLAKRGTSQVPPGVKCHPALPFWDSVNGEDGKPQWHRVGDFPAMVAAIRNPAGKTITLHATYIGDIPPREDGSSRPRKKVLSPCASARGGAIQLWPEPTEDRDAKHLGLAEGIETAIAAFEMGGGKHPVWATYSASFMRQFVVPKWVGRLFVYGDNDASFTGQSAAYELARRVKHETGLTDVQVYIPKKPGDWLDVMNERDGHT